MSKLLDIDVNGFLVSVLEQYDMKVEKVEDFFFVDGLFPGIVAQAFEMEDFGESVVVQLDITLLFPNDQFVESFVAQAVTAEDAVANAFEQFESTILHPFIMAFWDNAKKVENGVGTDVWNINGERWQVVISNYGYRGFEDFDSIIPDIDTMYDAIKTSIEGYPLTKDIYAVRSVYTNGSNDQQITEGLINNEEFPELQKAVSELKWSRAEEFYSVRNLILLMKLTNDAEA